MEPVQYSVILCTYAAPSSFSALLQSLAVQDFSAGEYEILAVDNSPGGVAKQVVENAVQANPSRAIYYLREPVPGKTRALNAGIRNARGEVVAFLDDDVSLESDWLSAVAQAFEDPQIGGIGGKVLPAWPGKGPSWFTPAVSGFTPVHDFGDTPQEYQPPGSCPVGANMAFRKFVLEQAGLFDLSLGHCGPNKLGGEEWDLCRKVCYLGHKVLYWPQAGAEHAFTWEEAKKSYWRRRAFTQGRVAACILFKDELPLLSKPQKASLNAVLHKKQPGRNIFYYQLKASLMAGFACGLVFGLPKIG